MIRTSRTDNSFGSPPELIRKIEQKQNLEDNLVYSIKQLCVEIDSVQLRLILGSQSYRSRRTISHCVIYNKDNNKYNCIWRKNAARSRQDRTKSLGYNTSFQLNNHSNIRTTWIPPRLEYCLQYLNRKILSWETKDLWKLASEMWLSTDTQFTLNSIARHVRTYSNGDSHRTILSWAKAFQKENEIVNSENN